MIFDLIWNLSRKSLTPNIYERFRASTLGRKKNHNTFEAYKRIYQYYSLDGLEFKNKSILELGPGNQFYTAFLFLSSGASSVYLVDPVFNEDSRNLLESQLIEFTNSTDIVLNDPFSKILIYNQMSSIRQNVNGQIDLICSHNVLEHYPKLKDFLFNSSRLLKRQGLCFSLVDLTNHAYHVFEDKKFTKWLFEKNRLNHYRYSDKVYSFITDSRIWVNRKLYPEYKILVNEFNFSIEYVKSNMFKKVRLHENIIGKISSYPENELYLLNFAFLLSKS